jgi:hypothetical protein
MNLFQRFGSSTFLILESIQKCSLDSDLANLQSFLVCLNHPKIRLLNSNTLDEFFFNENLIFLFNDFSIQIYLISYEDVHSESFT